MGGTEDRDQNHEHDGHRPERRVHHPETCDQTEDEYDSSLNERYRRAAERAPEHDVEPETGATRVSFRKPNWRSQMISIPLNTAVKRMPMVTMPGARNCR